MLLSTSLMWFYLTKKPIIVWLGVSSQSMRVCVWLSWLIFSTWANKIFQIKRGDDGWPASSDVTCERWHSSGHKNKSKNFHFARRRITRKSSVFAVSGEETSDQEEEGQFFEKAAALKASGSSSIPHTETRERNFIWKECVHICRLSRSLTRSAGLACLSKLLPINSIGFLTSHLCVSLWCVRSPPWNNDSKIFLFQPN
jgi:hypothetical protein